MRVSVKIITGIFLCFFAFNSIAQETKIIRSKEQVVISGKNYFLHTVKKGETIYSLSKAYNVPSLLILSCNNKKDHNLKIGELLKIPKDIEQTEDNIYYCLKQGETLFGVYRKTGTKVRKLLKANPELKRIDDIPLGTYIKIPKKYIKNKSFLKSFEEKKFNLEKTLAKKESVDTTIVDTAIDSIKRKKEKQLAIDSLKLISDTLTQIQRDSAILVHDSLIRAIDSSYIYSLENSPIVKNELNIAVFLPLYLDMNDTINKIDTTIITENIPERKIYNKSENFISFYQGVLMAVDSLKNKGYRINLYTYDTDKDRKRIDSILYSPGFVEMDLIIGPPYSTTFDVAAQYAQNHHIPIISPLSDKTSSIENNPYVVQLNTTQDIIYSKTADYIYNKHRNSNIVVVHTKDFKISRESAIITQLEDSLFTNREYMVSDDIKYKKISFDEYEFYGIKHLLNDSTENIIVVPCEDNTDINQIVPTLKALAGEYKIKLVGLPIWRRFTTMDPTCFFELNTTYLSPYHIDYKRKEVDAFVEKFRSMFFCEPDDFTFRAYDLSLYFIDAIGKGASYQDLCNNAASYYLQSYYKFKKTNPNGGIINTGLLGITYDRSYNISYEIIEK